LRLSFGRLRALFYLWRARGRDAITYKPVPARYSVSSPVMVRFLNLCASGLWPSYRAAWRASGLEGRPIRYAQATVYFTVAEFRALQLQRAVEESAQHERARMVNQKIEQLRRRLPSRMRRQRKARR
jgi:hypothetical protein